MHIRAFLNAVVACCAACGGSHTQVGAATDSASLDSAAPRSANTQWTVDPHGIGIVRVGMSLAQLSAAVGESLRPGYQLNETCDHVQPKALPKGVRLMILEDSVARIEVDERGVLTSEGAGVGDLESHVIALYGARARVAPHKYTGPTGHYVIVDAPAAGDTLYRIIFETDGQRVERYRAGRRPGVDYVEGCA
jgi:hypothetical protein